MRKNLIPFYQSGTAPSIRRQCSRVGAIISLFHECLIETPLHIPLIWRPLYNKYLLVFLVQAVFGKDGSAGSATIGYSYLVKTTYTDEHSCVYILPPHGQKDNEGRYPYYMGYKDEDNQWWVPQVNIAYSDCLEYSFGILTMRTIIRLCNTSEAPYNYLCLSSSLNSTSLLTFP